VLSSAAHLPPHDHAVNFYDDDAEAVASVTRYVLQGLTQGDRVVVVATAPHRAAVDHALLRLGTDPAAARSAGRYIALDASETLETFMVDDSPERVRFEANVGGILRAAAADGSAVRVFGEMVALLWDQGNVAGAIELESLWNELAAGQQFTLLCAYPTTVLDASPFTDITRVCDLHSVVVPPSSYELAGHVREDPEASQRSEVFLPVPQAVSAVRHLVVSALQEWGDDQLAADAALVASEMATNAIMHADSPLLAFIHRSSEAVLIGVKDARAGGLLRSPSSSDATSGRGISMVAALADAWGCDELPDGKIVWAEFSRNPSGHGLPSGPPTATAARQNLARPADAVTTAPDPAQKSD
jgi:anti-sigma regulatory factor (Ser/Thr protein kinase)